jgi:hypothetical protein
LAGEARGSGPAHRELRAGHLGVIVHRARLRAYPAPGTTSLTMPTGDPEMEGRQGEGGGGAVARLGSSANRRAGQIRLQGCRIPLL